MLVPRRTYICTLEYGLPGGCEFAAVPLHEVWEDLVPQLRVRVSGDVVEGDAESILRLHDQESAWFMVGVTAGWWSCCEHDAMVSGGCCAWALRGVPCMHLHGGSTPRLTLGMSCVCSSRCVRV